MSVKVMLWAHHLRIGLTPPQKLVLSVLAEHADDQGGNSWPSVATISAESEMAERTVQRALKELVEKKIVSSAVGGGRRNTTIYTLDLTLQCPIPAPASGSDDAELTQDKGVSLTPFETAKGDAVTPFSNGKGDALTPIPGAERVSDSPERVSESAKKGVSLTPEPVLNLSRKKERKVSSSLRSPRESATDSDFDAWWKLYPRHVARKLAARAYLKAVRSGATPAQLAHTVQHFAFSDDLRFIPYPATWLNGERWKDEAPTQRPAHPSESRKPFRNGFLEMAFQDWQADRDSPDVIQFPRVAHGAR